MAARDIFGDHSPFVRYDVTLQVDGKLVGGIPKNPSTIKSWIATRIERGEDLQLAALVEETAKQMTESGQDATFDDALTDVAANHRKGNGFKTVDGQLVYEGRCMKSAIKEGANVAYPGNKWPGQPANIRKGLRNFMAETVFVEEDFIGLGVSEPSGTEERVKHLMTPKGPIAAVGVVDFVDDPTLVFQVAVLDDCIKDEVWERLWSAVEYGGIGADRARGDGRCRLVGWERVA